MVLEEDMLKFIIAKNHKNPFTIKVSIVKNVDKMLTQNSTIFHYLRKYRAPWLKYHINRINKSYNVRNNEQNFSIANLLFLN